MIVYLDVGKFSDVGMVYVMVIMEGVGRFEEGVVVIM